MSIGNRIKECHMQLGISQAKLAKMINVSPGTIGNYEIDGNSLRDNILFKLLKTRMGD